MRGCARILALAHPLKTKPDKTHCALISAETKTDSASAKVTTISLVLGKPAPWSPVAGGPQRRRPALGAQAPLAGVAVLLVPHQGAMVTQALHAVPPVPAAPAEVLEAHLRGERAEEPGPCHTSRGAAACAVCSDQEGVGIPDGLCGVTRAGPGDSSCPPPTRVPGLNCARWAPSV